MYGNQSGEFVCGSWGLRAKTGFTQQENLSQTSKQALIVQMLNNASLLFHYYVILPYKVKRASKIRGRNTP